MARAVTFTGEGTHRVGSLADPSSFALWPNLMAQPCSRFQDWREAESEEKGILGVMKV